MTFVLKDRVKETTTVVGTGNATLLGAVPKYQSFAAIGDTNTTFYAIVHQTLDEWEVGFGTYTASGTLLTRNSVRASSNSNSLVPFSAGTKDVFCTYTAEDAIYLGGALGTPASGNLINCTGVPQTDRLLPITASVAGNALSMFLNPTIVDFRSPVVNSGVVYTRPIVAQLALVIASGITLGLAVSVSTRLLLIALDNAGVIELAVSRIENPDLDESHLLSTDALNVAATGTGAIAVTGIMTISGSPTGTWKVGMAVHGTNVPPGTFINALGTGAGAAGTYYTNCYAVVGATAVTGDAGFGAYSATARSNLPFRIVGFIDILEATPGTWASAPITIQGLGGTILSGIGDVGDGRKYYNMATRRVSNVTYYNNTAREIKVILDIGSYNVTAVVGGVTIFSGMAYAFPFTVPPGNSYSVIAGNVIRSWVELR